MKSLTTLILVMLVLSGAGYGAGSTHDWELDSLLEYHAADEWQDVLDWIPGWSGVGAGYPGQPLYLTFYGLPAWMIPVHYADVELFAPGDGLLDLNLIPFEGAQFFAGGFTPEFSRRPGSPDTVITDFRYHQAFYGHTRVWLSTQHPLPGGVLRAETRQQNFGGRFFNSQANLNYTRLEYVHSLFSTHELDVSTLLIRNRTGDLSSRFYPVFRDVRQNLHVRFAGTGEGWEHQHSLTWDNAHPHLLFQGRYDRRYHQLRWESDGALLFEKSLLRLRLEREWRESDYETDSISETMTGVGLEYSHHFKRAGDITLYSRWRYHYLKQDDAYSVGVSWVQDFRQQTFSFDLAHTKTQLPQDFLRADSSSLLTLSNWLPNLRTATTLLLPVDIKPVNLTRALAGWNYQGGRINRLRLEGFTAVGWNLPNGFLNPLSEGKIEQGGTQFFGASQYLDLQLPAHLRLVQMQTWQQDTDGYLQPELPVYEFAADLRYQNLFYQNELRFTVSAGMHTNWGAINVDGSPLSDQIIPHLHINARKGNFRIFWAWNNPFNLANSTREGVPGMHREEILGVTWTLRN